MALATALATMTASIAAVPEDGLANGVVYINAAQLASSHIPVNMKWPFEADGTARTLVDHICRYTRVDLATADRDAEQDKADIGAGVLVAVARLSAARYHGWTIDSMTPAEIVSVGTGEADAAVHADHHEAVAEAIDTLATIAPRMMGLFYYNAISYETHNHHHLPAVSKKLAQTTMIMSSLKEWCEEVDGRESLVFHDAFHPLSEVEKSNAARRLEARPHLSGLKFDNIGKRLPVKAPDTGIAINYPVLLDAAVSFRHDPAHVPADLRPSERLRTAIEVYRTAATPQELAAAVDTLRRHSVHLAKASAYLVGFIVGRMANATGDEDLTIRIAKRENTILGSPAYTRAATEHAGVFARGKEVGFANVAQAVPDQVMAAVRLEMGFSRNLEPTPV